MAKFRTPYDDAIIELSKPVSSASCSVFLYGSVQWGEWTLLRDGRLISDIDLLVVGKSLQDFRVAARHLSKRFAEFCRADSPLFKLGLKFRTHTEVARRQLTINDVTALLCGRLMSGPPVRLRRPPRRWFERQAPLVVPVRRECNATQRKSMDVLGEPLARYLAARTLLDIPTLLIRGPGDLRGSYRDKVARFRESSTLLELSEGERARVSALLEAALLTKMDPESHECGTLEHAETLLASFASQCGVVAAPGRGRAFWQAHRPLDVRDWNLRQSAL